MIVLFYHTLILFVLVIPPIAAWRTYKKNRENRKELLLSVAVTSILFNKTLQEAFRIPLHHIFDNLENLLTASAEFSTWKLKYPGLMGVKYPLDRIMHPVAGAILTGLPFGELICAFACFIILYSFLLHIKRQRRLTGVQENTKKNCLYYNLGILALLVFSLFLVISALIAIPYFREISKPSDYTKQKLDEALSRCVDYDTLQLPRTNNPFIDTMSSRAVLDSGTRRVYNGLTEKHRKEADEYITQLKAENDTASRQRMVAIGRMEQFARRHSSRQDRFREQLTTQFDAACLSRRTDKANLYQDCLDTFNLFVRNQKAYYLKAQFILDSIDAINQHVLKTHIEQIRQSITSISRSANESDRIITFPPGEPFSAYTYVEIDHADGISPPEYIIDGREWGLFGFIAWYLISTQSNELAILIGMIGVSILGASIPSFVKLGQKDVEEHFGNSLYIEPLIPNIGGVMARGVGAALLIYLASKGGFIFFTLGNPKDPDGYSLLLMCFIGATFSKNVWNWVNQTLKFAVSKEKANE